MYIHGFLWDCSDFPCLSVSAHTPTLCMSCARLALCSRIWILTAPSIVPPHLVCCLHIIQIPPPAVDGSSIIHSLALLYYRFYLFTSHPRCFVNPVDTNVWIPLSVSMHSIRVFSFLSYIFFLFRCRWYMINLSILSVVSNIKLSFCRLLQTEAAIVL